MNKVKCPICGSDMVISEFDYNDGLNHYECEECGHSFTNKDLMFCDECGEQIILSEKLYSDGFDFCSEKCKHNYEQKALMKVIDFFKKYNITQTCVNVEGETEDDVFVYVDEDEELLTFIKYENNEISFKTSLNSQWYKAKNVDTKNYPILYNALINMMNMDVKQYFLKTYTIDKFNCENIKFKYKLKWDNNQFVNNFLNFIFNLSMEKFIEKFPYFKMWKNELIVDSILLKF